MIQLREYRFGDFVVDLEAWQLSHLGQAVHLEPTVLKLLIFLIENRDRLVLKNELLDTVWGDTYVSESALSKAIARLRKALEDDAHSPKYIETVHALGYRFIAEVQDTEVQDTHQQIEKDPIPADTKEVTGLMQTLLKTLVCHLFINRIRCCIFLDMDPLLIEIH